MSVKTKHKLYVAMEKEWLKCMDFATSELAVHKRRETYLPRLEKQDDIKYEAYLTRAPVLMFALRAARAMTGMATRKEPSITAPKKLLDLLTSVDDDNNDFATYVSTLLFRFLFTGRGATLIDVPQTSKVLTVQEAEDLGVRPRFSFYPEVDIFDWREEKINNVKRLTLVILREEITVEGADEFTWESEYQYRVLDLHNGQYRQRLYNDAGAFVAGSEITPKMKNKPLPFIPIVIHGGIKPLNPPLNPIVDINLHHYQFGADEMEGLRMSALPTPYFFGMDPSDPDFPNSVGTGVVIGCSEADAKTGFREFTGAGMAACANKLQKFEDVIAMLSVQMTMENANASATGAAIDYANATASLAGVVDILSNEMQVAVRILAQWAGIDPDSVKCNLNKDFMPEGMDAQRMQALLQQWLSGGISYATYFKNLVKGEVEMASETPEEERNEIDNGLPPGLTGAGAVEDIEDTGDDE